MDNYRFDAQNFCLAEKITVAKISVDVIDNRTNVETNLLMLLDLDYQDYRDRVRQICRNLGYSVIQIGEPMQRVIDLDTLS